MNHPNLKEEKKLWKLGHKKVAGIDEAGRGPLAGPVVAGAVMIFGKSDLPKFNIRRSDFHNIKDSKKLTPEQREKLYELLIKHPNIEWGIGIVSEKTIDRINILEATRLAMKKAIRNLEYREIRFPKYRYQEIGFPSIGKIDFLILDGNFKINSSIPQKSIVKADEKVFSCSCASIIAKVTRDRIMQKYDKKYPIYGFNQHKGYPTELHRNKLRKYGPCKIHRRSFQPIKAIDTLY